MTIRRNPNQGDRQDQETFMNQAAGPQTSRLHCFIPAELHMEFKFMAVRQGKHVVDLVTEALENYMAERR